MKVKKATHEIILVQYSPVQSRQPSPPPLVLTPASMSHPAAGVKAAYIGFAAIYNRAIIRVRRRAAPRRWDNTDCNSCSAVSCKDEGLVGRFG